MAAGLHGHRASVDGMISGCQESNIAHFMMAFLH